MKHLQYLFLMAALILCPRIASAAPKIVTTTEDLADIAKNVGGNLVNVEWIASGKQDPHYIQAKPSYMVQLSRADLVVSVGLELEVGWLPSLINGARNPSIRPGKPGFLEASSAISPIDVPKGPIDRSQGDLHPFGNPHFWLDPENAKKVAKLLGARLGELDPPNRSAYGANAQRFQARIDQAMKRWQKAMAPFKGTKVVSYHRTFNYFFKRFGLSPIGYIEERPGIPPSPAHAAHLIREMQSQKVGIVFHENYFNRATSELIAKKASAKLLVLPTSVGGTSEAKNYEALIDHIVTSFVKGMR